MSVTGELDLSTPAPLGGSGGEPRVEGFSNDVSVVFSDLGGPITIEAPADAVEVPSDRCAEMPGG